MMLLDILFKLPSQLSDPQAMIQLGGWMLLLAIIYVETGFIIGMFLPGGDYTLFTAGLLCSTQVLDVPVFMLAPSLTLAAFLGDLTGFIKGRWLGPRLFTKEKSRFFKPSYLTRTKSFYDRYGKIAFITGKFLPVIRAIIPLLAGAAGFTMARFITISLIGSFLWTASLTTAGYLIGQLFPDVLDYKWYIMFGFILLASLPALKIFSGKKKTNTAG